MTLTLVQGARSLTATLAPGGRLWVEPKNCDLPPKLPSALKQAGWHQADGWQLQLEAGNPQMAFVHRSGGWRAKRNALRIFQTKVVDWLQATAMGG